MSSAFWFGNFYRKQTPTQESSRDVKWVSCSRIRGQLNSFFFILFYIMLFSLSLCKFAVLLLFGDAFCDWKKYENYFVFSPFQKHTVKMKTTPLFIRRLALVKLFTFLFLPVFSSKGENIVLPQGQDRYVNLFNKMRKLCIVILTFQFPPATFT
jgi:hypothetical protein